MPCSIISNPFVIAQCQRNFPRVSVPIHCYGAAYASLIQQLPMQSHTVYRTYDHILAVPLRPYPLAIASTVSNTLPQFKTSRIVLLPLVLYGCESWLSTLREERRLRMIENRVARKIFRSKSYWVVGRGDNYVMRSLTIYMQQILFGWSNQEDWEDGTCSVYGGQERCIQDFYGEHEGKRLVRRPRRGREGNNSRGGMGAWTGLISLGIGTYVV